MGSYRPLVLAASLFALAAVRAEAHPHVFVDGKTEVVFDQSGRMAAVRNIWQFDEAFTQYAIQGLDTNGDGKLSDAELKPLADVNVKSLKEYKFFTHLTVGRDEGKFVPPTEYWLEFHGGRLTLFFTLPLEKPMVAGKHTMLEIFDPEYFVAFTFVKDNPIKLVDAPKGCSSAYHPPRELDASTMAILAAIPVDQHDLPPELRQAASVLTNHITISCPIVPGAKPPAVAAAEPSRGSPSAAISGSPEDPGVAAAPPRASPSAAVKAASGDDGIRGTEVAKEEIAAVATPSDARTAAADEAQAPGVRAEPPSAGVAAGSTDAATGSNANLMTLVGLALFLAAAVGGVLALLLQRRSSRLRCKMAPFLASIILGDGGAGGRAEFRGNHIIALILGM
jgi:ABC-type uncharacterized transport system substrate-binding protein